VKPHDVEVEWAGLPERDTDDMPKASGAKMHARHGRRDRMRKGFKKKKAILDSAAIV
jgi:hypothetical protein